MLDKGFQLGRGLGKKRERLAHLEGWEPRSEEIPIGNLYESFRSRGLILANQIVVAQEDQDTND
ncbi:hypothetical protein CR513_53251, partial [Mucuna pruriens]